MAISGTLYKQGSTPSLYLEPNGSGSVNVLENFTWTFSRKESRKEVVPAILTEYQPNNSQLLNAIYYFAYQANIGNIGLTNFGGSISNNLNAATTILKSSNDPTSYYHSRYVATPTGFNYVFPYFGEQKFQRDNTFAVDDLGQNFEPLTRLLNVSSTWALAGSRGSIVDIRGSIVDVGKFIQYIGGIYGAVKTAVDGRIGTINTYSWRETTPENITITFDLENTGSLAETNQNLELCYLLHHQNTPVQRNVILTQGGCIYSLYIPDTIYMPVCYIKSYKVDNVGQNHYIGGRSIPESYRITLVFESIITPMTRNLLTYVNGNTSDPSLPNFGRPSVISSVNDRNASLEEAMTLELLKKGKDAIFSTPKSVFNFLNKNFDFLNKK